MVVATAVGTLLGQSAVDQINPLYFQGAAVHPRDRGAAIDERLFAQMPRFSDHYGWEEGQAARSADCNGCDALRARDAYGAGPHFAVIEPGWQVQAQPAAYYVVEEAPEAPPEEQTAPAEPTPLERYAAFPIEEKPAAAEPAAVEIVSADQ